MSEPYEPAEGPVSLTQYPMRVGTKLGRTLYVGTGQGHKHRDTYIGTVDTPELAQEIMTAVNSHYGHEEG